MYKGIIIAIIAFLLGSYIGGQTVLLKQTIWQEDGFFYAEFNDEVHEYYMGGYSYEK